MSPHLPAAASSDRHARQLFERRAAAGEWEGLYDGPPTLRSHPFQARLAAVERLLDRAGALGRVLDVAAGGGEFSAAVRTRQGRWVGLDASPAMLTLARRRTNDPVVLATAEAPPFAEASFDMLLVLGILGFLPAPRSTLRQLVRLLRPGGTMILQAGSRDLWSVLRAAREPVDAIERVLEPAELDHLLEEVGLRAEARIWIDFLPFPRRIHERLPHLSIRISNALQRAGGLARALARSHVTLARRVAP